MAGLKAYLITFLLSLTLTTHAAPLNSTSHANLLQHNIVYCDEWRCQIQPINGTNWQHDSILFAGRNGNRVTCQSVMCWLQPTDEVELAKFDLQYVNCIGSNDRPKCWLSRKPVNINSTNDAVNTDLPDGSRNGNTVRKTRINVDTVGLVEVVKVISPVFVTQPSTINHTTTRSTGGNITTMSITQVVAITTPAAAASSEDTTTPSATEVAPMSSIIANSSTWAYKDTGDAVRRYGSELSQWSATRRTDVPFAAGTATNSRGCFWWRDPHDDCTRDGDPPVETGRSPNARAKRRVSLLLRDVDTLSQDHTQGEYSSETTSNLLEHQGFIERRYNAGCRTRYLKQLLPWCVGRNPAYKSETNSEAAWEDNFKRSVEEVKTKNETSHDIHPKTLESRPCWFCFPGWNKASVVETLEAGCNGTTNSLKCRNLDKVSATKRAVDTEGSNILKNTETGVIKTPPANRKRFEFCGMIPSFCNLAIQWGIGDSSYPTLKGPELDTKSLGPQSTSNENSALIPREEEKPECDGLIRLTSEPWPILDTACPFPEPFIMPLKAPFADVQATDSESTALNLVDDEPAAVDRRRSRRRRDPQDAASKVEPEEQEEEGEVDETKIVDFESSLRRPFGLPPPRIGLLHVPGGRVIPFLPWNKPFAEVKATNPEPKALDVVDNGASTVAGRRRKREPNDFVSDSELVEDDGYKQEEEPEPEQDGEGLGSVDDMVLGKRERLKNWKPFVRPAWCTRVKIFCDMFLGKATHVPSF